MQNPIFHVTTTNVESGLQSFGFSILYDHISAAAFDNGDAFDDMKCFPGTRTLLLERLDSWLGYPVNPERLIIWLSGPMGSGKTAIARTIAHQTSANNRLIGTFMFSRTVLGRDDEVRFVATLAYQLALSIPLSRPFIEQKIAQDPAILQQSPGRQLEGLILEPLRMMRAQHVCTDITRLPNVIIVDGLDECGANNAIGKEERQITVLDLLHRLSRSQDILPFTILVLSRPERHLSNWFSRASVQRVTYQLYLDKSYNPEDDIRLFVTQSFESILEDHPSRHLLPLGWPYNVEHPAYTEGVNAIDIIVDASSGQFLYPSVVMKLLRSQKHRPDQSLLAVFGRSREANTIVSATHSLDTLYRQVLQSADDHQNVLKLLAYHAFSDYAPRIRIPLRVILRLLDISYQDLQDCIDRLEAIVTFTLKPFFTFHHSSFREFLDDKARARNCLFRAVT
ncbi:hypothetical protein CVT24_010144 [Panaeolus cyanescens]|uniref:Nephrocystin 3-like N-terminal domain-containing protein n=1 Tax=Panaeolus cyanescens TaxID=181874 RepID=A0A409WLV4_9AGAR|nr:hypothetical protein CVT24_010144 [Panaeolus cyanescens]